MENKRIAENRFDAFPTNAWRIGGMLRDKRFLKPYAAMRTATRLMRLGMSAALAVTYLELLWGSGEALNRRVITTELAETLGTTRQTVHYRIQQLCVAGLVLRQASGVYQFLTWESLESRLREHPNIFKRVRE
ncbi:MAG: helix-turn-helix domain-containing protein [Acholeplasmataceae bacterium]